MAAFYTTPTNLSGGYIVYKGSRRQRGAGIFGSLRQYMSPIGRQALQGIKKIARNKTVQNIAKKAAAKGAEVLTTVAVDALHGRDVGESLRERSREAALRALTGDASAQAPPSRKRKASSAGRRSRKRAKKLKQRKRLGPAKQILQGPPPKRRRQGTGLSRAALNRRSLF